MLRDATVRRPAFSSSSRRLPAGLGNAQHRDGHGLVQADASSRKRVAEEDDGPRAGLRRLGRGVPGIGSGRDERGLTRDEAEPVLVEELAELRGRTLLERGLAQRRCAEPERKPLLGGDRSGERSLPVEQDPEPGSQHEMHRGRGVTKVRGADRERGPRPAGPGDAAVAGPREAVVAGRGDDERVEPEGSGDRPRGRAVLERGERLGNPDERDPRRVECDAVGVRIDCALEPGNELVGATVDGPAPGRLSLPARDPDREHRRPAGDAVHLRRAFRADEQAGELGAVPLEAGRVVGAGLRLGILVSVDHVEALAHLPEHVRMVRLDAGVEQRDRHAGPVEARQLDGGPGTDARRQLAFLDQCRGRRSRVRDAHGIDACDLRSALEVGDGAGIERRGEAGQHAGVAVLWLDLHALPGEPCDEQVVGGERGRGPAPLLRLGRLAARGSHLVGERRTVQDDDDALADRDLLARGADEAAPGRGRRLRFLVAGASGPRGDREQCRSEGKPTEHAQLRGLTPP